MQGVALGDWQHFRSVVTAHVRRLLSCTLQGHEQQASTLRRAGTWGWSQVAASTRDIRSHVCPAVSKPRIMYVIAAVLSLLCACAQGFLIDPDVTAGSHRSKGNNALWQLQLDPGQCTGNSTRCYNIYAIDDSTGALAWFAFSTDVTAIRSLFLGRRSVYYTTWSGPSIYAVNRASGHVRWQYPASEWFRYWVKDIDLPPGASFKYAAEVGSTVYISASSTPGHVYGVAARTGDPQWEYRASSMLDTIVDLAGPDAATPSLVYLSVTNQTHSWLQSFNISTGRPSWTSEPFPDAFSAIYLSGQTILAANQASNMVRAYSTQGQLVWEHQGVFCQQPVPWDAIFGDTLLLPTTCQGLLPLVVLRVSTGEELWRWGGDSSSSNPTSNPDGEDSLANNPVMPPDAEPAALDAAAGAAAGPTAAGQGFTPTAGLRGPADPLASATAAAREGTRGTAAAGKGAGGLAPLAGGNCSWVGVHEGKVVLFYCDCDTTNHPPAAAVEGFAAGSSSSSSSGKPPSEDGRHLTPGGRSESSGLPVCLFCLDWVRGKQLWVVQLPGRDASPANSSEVPPDSQQWGLRPYISRGVVAVPVRSGMHGVALSTGKLLWSQPLDSSLEIVPWQQPLVDKVTADANHTLVWTAKKTSKTLVYASDFSTGRLLWAKGVNGTAQVPLAADGPSGMGLSSGKVILETCKGVSCCLRAFNLTNGKARWVLCLDAVRGEDATHPQAQFAIWLITVVTVGSIALLVLVAMLVYMQRWYEDGRILHGTEDEAFAAQYMQLEGRPLPGGAGLLTPARNYRPLPQLSPQHSDSEDSPRRRFEGSPAVRAALLVQQQGGRWEQQQSGPSGLAATTRAIPAAAAAAGMAGASNVGGSSTGSGQPPVARPGQVGEAGRWYGSLPRVQGQRRQQ